MNSREDINNILVDIKDITTHDWIDNDMCMGLVDIYLRQYDICPAVARADLDVLFDIVDFMNHALNCKGVTVVELA